MDEKWRHIRRHCDIASGMHYRGIGNASMRAVGLQDLRGRAPSGLSHVPLFLLTAKIRSLAALLPTVFGSFEDVNWPDPS